MSEVEARILETLQKTPLFLAALATISETGEPWVRYVTGRIEDDLTIRVATSLESKKVAHVRVRPAVHLACGDTTPGETGTFLQIEGTASISTDNDEKAAVWYEELGYYFKRPDDPSWCVFKIVPHRITVHSMTSVETAVWERAE